MSYKHISTHNSDAKERLIEQHKGKPNLETVIDIFTTRTQALEDDLRAKFENTALSVATGSELDLIAKTLSVLRQASDDEELRAKCFAKIANYWSSGRIETIVTIIKLLCGVDKVYITEVFPAKISVELITDQVVNREIRSVIQSALAAGVQLNFFIVTADVDYFGFENDWRAFGFATLDEPEEGGYYSISF